MVTSIDKKAGLLHHAATVEENIVSLPISHPLKLILDLSQTGMVDYVQIRIIPLAICTLGYIIACLKLPYDLP